jgi:hypothetical protein
MPAAKNRSFVVTALFASIAATAAIVSACSGKTTDDGAGGDGGSQSDGAQSDAAPRPPDCPASAPADGDACSHDQLVCEYGDDFDPRCNVVRVCSGTRWASPVSFGGTASCPTTPPTVPPNPSDCAPTRAAVPTGTACSSSSTCSYDGSTCFCARYCPSYPIRQPDCDAGQTVGCCNATVQWNCFDGPPFCPTPRPRVGSACSKEGDSCAVSAPVECGQPTLDCTKGVWTFVDYGCPVSTARAKRDIAYVDDETEERLRRDLMSVHLATYRYKTDDASHLGFIIEDMPEGSPAVLASRDRVDLYGFVSMAVAAIHAQQREIDALKRDVAKCQAPAARR